MGRILRLFIIVVFVFSFAPNWAMAQGHSHSDAVTSATPKLGQDEVVITGRIICLGCYLKKEKQAKAQCSIYGHTNAVIIEKAINPEGKHVAGVEGGIYQFLHNDQSDKLINNHSFEGKEVIITGKIYSEANIIEVNFFKNKGEEDK
ncbi:MAG: hypothetical protein NC936_04075 [Candidatus Omnitrophica bacterium]|nr:hypothetical protein [Candidatus Omnitrophota bacterium]